MPAPGWSAYSVPLVRSLRRGLRRSIVPECETAKRVAGDYAWVRLLGPAGFYLLSDPRGVERIFAANPENYIRGEPPWTHLRRGLGNGLVTSDGDFHRRQRRLVGAELARPHLAAYCEVTREEGERTLADWELRAGTEVDLLAEMFALTARIIVRLLFGLDDPAEAVALSRAAADVNRAASTVDLSLLGLLPFVPTRTVRTLRRAVAQLEGRIYGLIEERRREPGAHRDILARLLASHLEAEADPAVAARQVRDEAMTLFGAGHETSAGLLAWTWHLLATHPQIERRWHQEIDGVLGGRPARLDDLPRLPYTVQILRESMRLLPPVWINGRQAVEPDEIEGRRVEPGMMIWIFCYLLHRDERWFPDPLAFDPERFRAGSIPTWPRFAYLPFGGGNRHCVGASFAEAEAALLLATLGQRFAPRHAGAAQVELEPMVTLQPRGGLPMRLAARGGTE